MVPAALLVAAHPGHADAALPTVPTMSDKILDGYDVAKRVESDAWRLWRSLHAALELEDEVVLRMVETRVVGSGVLRGLLADLRRLEARNDEAPRPTREGEAGRRSSSDG